MNHNANTGADQLKQEARRWVMQLASGEATTADAEALRFWRRQDPAHEAAYADAVRIWRALGDGGRVFVERHGAPVWPRRSAGVTTRRALLAGGGALAASVAAVAIVKPPLDLWPSWEELRSDYRTATGEQRQVNVADVTVRLNTQTSVTVSSDLQAGPSVRLIAGQASFAMPPQSARSLIVFAGNGKILADRARFDVRCQGDTTFVTCIDGSVEVTAGKRAETVGHGQQVVYDDSGLRAAPAGDVQEATSWQDGYIVFRRTALSDAVVEINRYRPGRVMVLNAALGRKTVSGRFRTENMDEVLGWIERATGASARSLPGGIVLLS
ncbi:MAG: iron dicitrate transport regulator FecR [Bradyrhizobiaceae bacterium PARB1]|nr:MAG: iron dicitrate transport regulator FecR [Bradyrhizobiaceae bacterium PARB1]